MQRSDIDQVQSTITIRRVGDGDGAEVDLLSARDSRPIPEAPLLGIEVEGRLLAVTSLVTGATIADPFRPTAEPRAMLELRAAQLRRANGRRRGLRIRLPGRPRASIATSPPGAGGRLLTLSRP